MRTLGWNKSPVKMNSLQTSHYLILQSCLSEFLSSGRGCFSLEMNQIQAPDQLSVSRSRWGQNTRVYTHIPSWQSCSCQASRDKWLTVTLLTLCPRHAAPDSPVSGLRDHRRAVWAQRKQQSASLPLSPKPSKFSPILKFSGSGQTKGKVGKERSGRLHG